jgi:hypothetical protein
MPAPLVAVSRARIVAASAQAEVRISCQNTFDGGHRCHRESLVCYILL